MRLNQCAYVPCRMLIMYLDVSLPVKDERNRVSALPGLRCTQGEFRKVPCAQPLLALSWEAKQPHKPLGLCAAYHL